MAHDNEKITEELNEEKRKEIWIQLAVALGLTIAVGDDGLTMLVLLNTLRLTKIS